MTVRDALRNGQLSLSTNCIQKITNLNGLRNLKILSLGKNNIKALAGLLEKLKGIQCLKRVRVVYMSNNLVKDWGEFMRLAELQHLADLVFVGNPLEEKHSAEGTWMDEATKRLPGLRKLDRIPVIKWEGEEGEA